MRWLVAFVLITACYRPSLDHERCVLCGTSGECPGELACIDGYCGGSQTCTQTEDSGTTSDAPGDTARRSCELVPFEDPLALGIVPPDSSPASFTTDAAATFGAFKHTTTKIGTTPLSSPMFATVLDDAVSKNYAPHLSPEGNELFVQTDVDGMQLEYGFRVSYRNGGDWSAPQTLTLRNDNLTISINGTDFPGTPTAFAAGPRRMMFLREQPGAWIELQEASPSGETWDQVATYAAPRFGLLRIYHPQLSADGLRVVFVGEGASNSFAIYVATRTDATEPFSGATVPLVSVNHGAAHPFLSDDCRTLYYDLLGTGIVKHAPP